MKSSVFLFALLLSLMPLRAPAQASPSANAVLSPTDSRIADDRRQIAGTPDKFQPYNDLALALIGKSRENGDTALVAEAEATLKIALRLAPDNIQVLKTRVALLLAKHEFVRARAEAKALNSRMPDDVSIYGYLATADIELGNYDEAETQAQWMLNLLPNNVPGLLIGARLREIYGDPEGALEFLKQARGETPSPEIEVLADIEERIARVLMNSGKIDAADEVLQQVLKTYPGYAPAVEDLANVKAAGKRREIAVDSLNHQNSLSALGGQQVSASSAVMPWPSPPSHRSVGAPGASGLSLQPIPQQLLSPQPTETDHVIRSLQAKLSHEPNEPALYARLGAAFFQKARETGDVAHFELAEKALKKSLDLISHDLAAAGPAATLAQVYMGEHRFAEALKYARTSLALGAGDLSPFAIAGDAYADIGEYDQAMEAYNKLDAAESKESYARDSRVAFLKFVSGDTDAAIQLMQRSIANGVAAQLPSENLAWLYYELGEFCFQNGNAAEADRSYLAALAIHPGDYRALAGLARLRATQGLYADAIELYQKALVVVPMPLFAAELGDVYARVGRPEDAKKQFRLVEYIGALGAINQVLHNRDLALFYADHDMNLSRALDLAKKEFEVRHDIYTWDVLAWALYKNGRLSEAADAIAQALRFNTKDALLRFHAGMIYRAVGQETKAREYLSQALEINPRFHVVYADAALRLLAELDRLRIGAQSRNVKAGNQ